MRLSNNERRINVFTYDQADHVRNKSHRKYRIATGVKK